MARHVKRHLAPYRMGLEDAARRRRKGGACFQPPTQNKCAKRLSFRARAGGMFALRGAFGGRLEARPSFTRHPQASSCTALIAVSKLIALEAARSAGDFATGRL